MRTVKQKKSFSSQFMLFQKFYTIYILTMGRGHKFKKLKLAKVVGESRDYSK